MTPLAAYLMICASPLYLPLFSHVDKNAEIQNIAKIALIFIYKIEATTFICM